MAFFRELGFTLKNTFRDKNFVFWTIMYPLILTTFFYLAFGSLLVTKEVKFNVGIEKDAGLDIVFGNVPVFELKSFTAAEAEHALKEREIVAFVNKDLEVTVSQSGSGQSVVQNSVQIMKQLIYAFENGANEKAFQPEQEYVKEKTMELSPFSALFYTILAMVSFYGFFGIIDVISGIQANISDLGKRMCVSPVRKFPYIVGNVLLVFLLNLLSNLLVIAYMNYILKIELFSDYPRSIALLAAGNLLGVCMGIYVGGLTLKPQVKAAIGIGVPILMSAFAGMMSIEIKGMIMRYFPIVDKLNPASIITGGLYRVNLFGNDKGYLFGMSILLGLSVLFLVLAVGTLRRKSYDSF